MPKLNNAVNQDSEIEVMEEIANQKVVQGNRLIMGVAEMHRITLKVFEIAVASIDTENAPRDRTVHIKKALLYDCLNLSTTKAKYSRLNSVLKSFLKQSVFSIKGDVEKGEKENRIIAPVVAAEWNGKDDYVSIVFSELVMPFLVDLKKNFTQYQLSEITGLKGKYSIPLFKILCMYFNQYENYKKMNKFEKLKKYEEPVLEIGELRSFLNIPKKSYLNFSDFKRRVLDLTLKDINAHTSLNVEFSTVQSGRKVTHVRFHISRKAMAENSYYKAEQNDPAFAKHQEEKKKLDEFYLEIAQNSPHTFTLLQTKIIKQSELFKNDDLMIQLARNVYPYYDKLIECTNNDFAVRTHLQYVNEHIEDYSENKKNIVVYLKKSITRYLDSEFHVAADMVKMYELPEAN